MGVRNVCVPNVARNRTWSRGKTCGPNIFLKDGDICKRVNEFSIGLFQRESLVGDSEGKCYHRFSINQDGVGEVVDCGDYLVDEVCVVGLEPCRLGSLSGLYKLFVCDGEVSFETGPDFSAVGFLFQILQLSLNIPVEKITLYAVLIT